MPENEGLSSTFAIISVVDKTDDSIFWTEIRCADRLLKWESKRLLSVNTISHREFVLRMAIIQKANKIMMKAFIELDLDPEEFEDGKETKVKAKREIKIVQIFS